MKQDLQELLQAVKEYLEAKDKLDAAEDYEANDYRWHNAKRMIQLRQATLEWVKAEIKLKNTFEKVRHLLQS